jgi:hypothetical protein
MDGFTMSGEMVRENASRPAVLHAAETGRLKWRYMQIMSTWRATSPAGASDAVRASRVAGRRVGCGSQERLP